MDKRKMNMTGKNFQMMLIDQEYEMLTYQTNAR